MSAVLAERELPRLQSPYRWTVAEYHQMAAVGLLHEDSPVELINGEVVEMAPIGSPHGGEVKYFNNKLVSLLHDRVIVSVQDPVILNGYAEPQPDIALLRWRDDYYRSAHPHAEDVLLLIEVSETTLRYDREFKVPLYASSAIPEVWLVDLQNRQLEVYREPVNGEYRHHSSWRTGQIAPLLCPDAMIDLAELFPRS